jgi:protein-disulfide isomerase
MSTKAISVKAPGPVRSHARARALLVALASVLTAMSLGAAPVGAARLAAPPHQAPAPRAAAAKRAAAIDAVGRLLHGIPEQGNALGYASAPVTLQVFGDLECPICKELALGVLGKLIKRDVRTRKLKIEYRSLETATREREVFYKQQVAALAAGRQDKMWYFVELFYREQGQEDSGYVDNAYLRGIARQVPGLNLAAWEFARRDLIFAEAVYQDEQVANLHHFLGTPSFLLGRTGQRLRTFQPSSYQESGPYEAAINRLVRKG